MSNVWFDRYETSIKVPEHKETLNQTCEDLVKFIEDEMTSNNLTNNQIILGGFSMGGALAIHLAFRYLPKTAAVFAMSSFLNRDTNVYEKIKASNSRSPIFMAHGKNDTLVNHDWGYETFQNLKKVQVGGEFHSFDGDHELSKKVLFNLKDWILNMLPK